MKILDYLWYEIKGILANDLSIASCKPVSAQFQSGLSLLVVSGFFFCYCTFLFIAINAQVSIVSRLSAVSAFISPVEHSSLCFHFLREAQWFAASHDTVTHRQHVLIDTENIDLTVSLKRVGSWNTVVQIHSSLQRNEVGCFYRYF